MLSAFDGAEVRLSHTVELVKEKNWNAARESDFEPVIVCGDASVLIRGQYDIVLANMVSYVRALKPRGGRILLSGFFTADIPMLLEKAVSPGLSEVSRRTRDDWALLVLKKGDA